MSRFRKLICAFLSILMILSMLTMLSSCSKNEQETATEVFSYEGKKIGVLTGSYHDTIVEENCEGSELLYFENNADGCYAVQTQKIYAMAVDQPVARYILNEYKGLKMLTTLKNEEYAYIFTKGSERGEMLCAQMNKYLAKIKADGTLEEIDAMWFGTDETAKVIDYSGSDEGKNGEIIFTTCTSVGAPFAYIKDGKFAGYDVDIAVRFAKEYGYSITIIDNNVTGELASVESGKSDFAGNCIGITEERKERMLFSDANYCGGVVLIGKKSDSELESKNITSVEDLAGKNISLLTGSIFDEIARECISEPNIIYCDSNADICISLELGRADAFITDQPIARNILKEYEDFEILKTIRMDDYAYIFNNSTEKGNNLCFEMNEFLAKIKKDGTLKELDSKWFGNDESIKIIDFSGTEKGKNGTLTFATSTSMGAPFSYLKDGKFAGYDIDIAVQFCKEYGYGINIVDGTFSSLIAEIQSGKADFAASCITVTEERKEKVLFSDANYVGGIVIVIKNSNSFTNNDSEITGTKDLAGETIGVLNGSVFDLLVEEKIENANIFYCETVADLGIALDLGKVKAIVGDEPLLSNIIEKYEGFNVIELLKEDENAFIFNKESGQELCAQMNEYLAKNKENGTLDVIKSIWFGNDEDLKVVDYSGLNNNGRTLVFATSSVVGAPFSYIKNGKFAGYDIDIAVRFCREYGYNIEIVDCNFSGMIAEVQSGKANFAGACIIVTDERKERVLFAEPNYIGSTVLVINTKELWSKKLENQNIGVLTGTIFDEVAKEYITNPNIFYCETNADLCVSLEANRTAAFLTDQPVARYMLNEYSDLEILKTIRYDDYAYVFNKDTEKGNLLCSQMNKYLAKIKTDGTLQAFDSKWFGDDEEIKTIDFSGTEKGENGTLVFATSSSVGAPFSYIKNGEFAGYDVDIAVQFCKEYGYGIEIVDCTFSAIVAEIQSDKADFSAACITVTDERKEKVLFSDANYVGGMVAVVKNEEASGEKLSFIEDLKGRFKSTFILESRWKLFAQGVSNTMLITTVSIILGTALGFLLYMIGKSFGNGFDKIVTIFSGIFQGMPVVVLLMCLFYIIFAKSEMNGTAVSIIGFTLLFGFTVYGMLKRSTATVGKAQLEASYALGFNKTQTFFKVVMPQAARHFLPAFKAEVVTHIKATAVVGYVAVQDLTKMSDIVRSRTYDAFFPLIVTAIIYFVLEFILTSIVNSIEINTDPKHRSKEKILKGVEIK